LFFFGAGVIGGCVKQRLLTRSPLRWATLSSPSAERGLDYFFISGLLPSFPLAEERVAQRSVGGVSPQRTFNLQRFRVKTTHAFNFVFCTNESCL